MNRFEHVPRSFGEIKPGEQFSWPEHYNKALVKFQEPLQGYNAVSMDYGSLVKVDDGTQVLRLEQVS